jgi:thioesterase superfamily protein
MERWFRFATIVVLSLVTAVALGSSRGMTQPRAHVYLFRGLADVFSTGMDTLADEINTRGVYATSHSHTDWKAIADKAAANYKSGKEGPIILIGHSLGADAVMEMADYLGDKGVPVALVVPFDCTQSFPAPGNVARVLNLTQRDYAFMRPGPGFRGALSNVDLSSDQDITHLNIDKSPQLHARVIAAVLATVGGRPLPTPKPASSIAPESSSLDGGATAHRAANGSVKSERPPSFSAAPTKSSDGATDATKLEADSHPSVIDQPVGRIPPASSTAPAALPSGLPVVAPRPVDPAQIPN